MDLFSIDDLQELLREASGPAVSIYLPRPGPAPDPAGNRLRFRAALDRARELIEDDPRFSGRADVLEPLEPLARDPGAWSEAGGFAIFQSPEVGRRFRLPARFPELTVVAPTFHTRPLIEYLQAPDRFWILELAQKGVRLWAGDQEGVRPVEPSPLPSGIDDLGYEFSRDPEVVHRAAGGGGRRANIRAQGGGSVGAFHGHGTGDDDRDPELEALFREVDEKLREQVDGQSDPIILAGVAEHHPLYRGVTSLRQLTPRGIEVAIRDWSPDRIHEQAWPIALEAANARTEEALDLWEAAFGQGKAEPDLASIGPLAVAGRVRLLLTERDRRVWGTVDRETGAVGVRQDGGEDPGAQAVEVLDELSELVLSRRGETRVVEKERMPTETGAAAILR